MTSLNSIACVQTFRVGSLEHLTWVVSNHWTGSWTGLWTGLLDWITGSTFELNLFVSPDPNPIRRVERSHDFISTYMQWPNIQCQL